MMKVGHARFCLTPQFEDFYLIGYRSENRLQPASGVHDDIFCNALMFEDAAGERVFIFSADFLEFEESMAEDVKTLLAHEFGLNRDLVLLCATHDHNSIASYHRSWWTGKFDQRYYDFLLDTIRRAVGECIATLVPACARSASKVVEGWFGNRNHEGRLADNTVTVVEFTEADSQGEALPDAMPFAGFVNWATHSTVISGDNTWLTSDLAGEVSKKLGKRLGYYPAMIVGAAGDCSNRWFRKGRGFDELERESLGLAEEIAGIRPSQEIALTDIRYQTLFHTVHHDMGFVHDIVRDEMAKLEAERDAGCSEERAKFIKTRLTDLRRRLDVHEFHLDAKGWVIDLGGMQLMAFPGELGSAFGIQMREACPKLGIVAGYCNGYYEYFLPAAEYGLSFETVGGPIPQGEPEKLVAKFCQAEREVALTRC